MKGCVVVGVKNEEEWVRGMESENEGAGSPLPPVAPLFNGCYGESFGGHGR